MDYQELGTEIGELVDRKNAAYGSSFAKCGEFLRLLYPQGLRPDQMTDALLLVRIFDKQVRIATDADALGESPYRDIAGYGLLGARMQHERMNEECGSVRVDVGAKSQEPNGSAEQSANAQTTPSAAASSAPTSPQPSQTQPANSSNATDAPAANPSSAAEEVALARNKNDLDPQLKRLRCLLLGYKRLCGGPVPENLAKGFFKNLGYEVSNSLLQEIDPKGEFIQWMP